MPTYFINVNISLFITLSREKYLTCLFVDVFLERLRIKRVCVLLDLKKDQYMNFQLYVSDYWIH